MMHLSEPQAHEPKGPTTGPLHPVIVVMDTTTQEEEEERDPLPEQDGHRDEEEQDRLPPLPEEQEQSTPSLSPEEPDEPDEPAPSPREPRPLSLPGAGAQPRAPHPPRSLLIVGSLGISTILLAVAIGIVLAVNPQSLGPLLWVLPGVTPTASVTLTPVQKRLHTSVPLTAVTGTPDPSRGQVSARLLSVKSSTLTRTVPATGHGHTSAQAAAGTLTFYNAAPYAQTVAAGTVLTSTDGVQVVTNQPAYLPAGNLPVVGMATVSAQAVQVGPQGNIAPLSLNGLCCVAGVSVKNTDAFTGGQRARDYPVVAPQDVEAITEQASPTLTGQAQTSLQAEVRPGEQLTGPAQCRPVLHTDHPLGSEATHVTITLRVTCQGEVYDQQAVQQLASAALSAQARTTLGIGYSVQGPLTTTTTQIATTEAAHGTLSLLVGAQGTWAYQFSSVQISQLTRRIAGLPRQAALHLLQHDPHVQAVSITESWNVATLPNDPAHIQVMVLGTMGG